MTTVEVTTAVELTAELRKQVSATAKQKLGQTEFELIEKVDPTVIGGVKLSIAGKVYDATVAHKLQLLKQA